MFQQLSHKYTTKRPHRFFNVTNLIVGKEVKPGYTVTFVNEIDLSKIEEIRKEWQIGKKPTYTAFIAKALAIALQEHPYANRRLYKLPLLGTRLQTFNDVRIAVACERDIPGVEVAAFMDILANAEEKSLSEITTWLFDLANCDLVSNRQWRDFHNLIIRFPSWLAARLISLPLHSPQLWWKWRGGAAVISSPGKYGVDTMIGTWPSPIGISFGFAKNRPIVRNNELSIGKTMFLTLNFDRRVMAGAQAAKFFRRLCDILEAPAAGMKPFIK